LLLACWVLLCPSHGLCEDVEISREVVDGVETQAIDGISMPEELSEEGRIVATADELEYDRKTGWVEGRGNVVIRKDEDELRADHVRMNVKTQDAHASGNVHLEREKTRLNGDSFDFNLDSGTGRASRVTCESEPFRVIASESAKLPGDKYVFQDAMFTTCTNASSHLHYHIRARELAIVPGKSVQARRVVWYMGRVPILYLPRFSQDLEDELGFRFLLGHTTEVGAFLLSSYRFRMTGHLYGETHVDYRTERGFGFGQDVEWVDLPGNGYGDLSLYYARDMKPIDDDEDPETVDIDNDRYRARLRHSHDFTDRDYMLLRANYVSDTDILEDFFEDEHRGNRQPDNHVVFTRRADKFTANLLAQARLNDFFTAVNRLPELSIEFGREQIGNSLFYYEGETTAAYLGKVWETSETNEQDHSAFRFDSLHTVYLPTRHFAFLNVIPRAGYRGTYYSRTLEPHEVVTSGWITNSVTDAGGNVTQVPVFRTETNTVYREARGDMRSLAELGVETSFKAFRTWSARDRPLRHIVEPYADYTFVPEPTLTPDRLPQFDKVDELEEEHSVLFGARNKLQVKKRGKASDLVDADVHATYNIEPEDGHEHVEEIGFDIELRPVRWFGTDIDGEYDLVESTFGELNTRLMVDGGIWWEAEIEHRFKADDSNLLAAELTLLPDWPWSFGVYGRHEFEDDRFEETWAHVQRNLDCMALRIGMGYMPGYTRSDGTEAEPEWGATFEFWLTAFPGAALSVEGSHKH